MDNRTQQHDDQRDRQQFIEQANKIDFSLVIACDIDSIIDDMSAGSCCGNKDIAN